MAAICLITDMRAQHNLLWAASRPDNVGYYLPNRILKYRVVVPVVPCFVVSLFQIHLALELICGLVPHG